MAKNKTKAKSKNKPKKPTAKQPTTPKRTAPVKHEKPTTSALTIVQPKRRQYHQNEVVFSIVRKRPKPNELPELSVRLCGKEIAQVPVPEHGELREEVDVIMRLLVRRMAELLGECRSAGDVPAAVTRIKPALDLLRLVGAAYL